MSFADDTKLYHGISNVDDCSFFQNDLNSVYDWASCNNMSFNGQNRRERYIIIYVWNILEGLVPNLSLLYVLNHGIVEGGPVSRPHINVGRLGTLECTNSFRCHTNYLCLYVILLYVLLMVSRNNLIATYLQCLILRVNQDSTTAGSLRSFEMADTRDGLAGN